MSNVRQPLVKEKKKKSDKPKKKKRERFDGQNGEHWQKIPSKGQLFMLAIAAFNGAKFPGSELFGSRENAKPLIDELKKEGYIDGK